jgi:AmmeMemoRadiSam system protein A
MAPSPSADRGFALAEIELLLDIADGAIVDGLLGGPPAALPVAVLPTALRAARGVFVTLTVDGELNGCIGSIQGVEPLGHGTARHAWSAAFADPRLPALRRVDYGQLTIEVSVLSPLEPMPAMTRSQLLDDLCPGVDGLLIAAGARQGVFLPAVWDQLPEPTMFLDHLQAKAGMQPGWWPAELRAWRFTAEKFVRRAGEQRSLAPPAHGRSPKPTEVPCSSAGPM